MKGGIDMPKTLKQEIVFGIVMVLFMVYAMICYNLSIAFNGLSNIVFIEALKELPIMALIAFVVEELFVGKLARKITFNKLNPKETNPLFITILISCLTVMFMCPIMSFIASTLFNFNGVENIIVNFISTTVRNFPKALLYQLLLAGPIVRLIFSKIFK